MSELFLRNEMLLGKEACSLLSSSHVAVFGLGGVGSWCAEALCRAGIGALTIVDEDTVSKTNINRQLIALHSTIGQDKTLAMASRLRDINPQARIRQLALRYEASSRESFFDCDYDFVVDCIDLVSCKIDLIETAQGRGIPIVSALGTGNKLDAQALRLADIYETKNDPLARVVRRELRKRGIERLTVVCSDEESLAPEGLEEPPPGRRSVPGSLVWVPASAGLLLCQHVVTSLISAQGTS